ncbi:cyclin-dependent kinase CDK7 [Acrasis kona]|uniref:[RNA-polymerase]-subunit kinase n=1 Tax=Acrasis kona TaxID=1008807 RepID=A0AAW2Z3C5_9EUKA
MQFIQQITENKHERYTRSHQIGEGTFGVVYKGLDTKTGQTVAVKKIKMGKLENGISFSAVREIKVLQELKHPNIIDLVDVFLYKSNVYLVYEYMDTDLYEVIRDQSLLLSTADVKGYMKYILEGVEACHHNWVLHRDLKPSNVLVSRNNDVKLADFGLAKVFGSPDKRYSPQCITLWYKPPELLYGANLYGPTVDMWSIGCIFAELMLRRPFLPGNNDLDQLGKIFQGLGTPTDSDWPDMRSLPNFIEFDEVPKPNLKQVFTAATPDAIDLISKMFTFDPNKRITAKEALSHPYFSNQPKPTAPHDLPLPKKVFETESASASKTIVASTTLTVPQPSRVSSTSKVLNFDDISNAGDDSLNLSTISALSGSTLNESLNHSHLVDDVEVPDIGTPFPYSVEKRRRSEDGDEEMENEDNEFMNGERPPVRRKLAM